MVYGSLTTAAAQAPYAGLIPSCSQTIRNTWDSREGIGPPRSLLRRRPAEGPSPVLPSRLRLAGPPLLGSQIAGCRATLAQFLPPDVFRRIQFRAACGRPLQPHLHGYYQIPCFMPVGSIEHHKHKFMRVTPSDFGQK